MYTCMYNIYVKRILCCILAKNFYVALAIFTIFSEIRELKVIVYTKNELLF